MKIKGVIFDLDGTLVNSLADLAESVNQALRGYGFPEHAVEDYRMKVGDGVKKLLERSLPEGEEDKLEAIMVSQRAYYQEHFADETVPYAGVPAMLKELREQGGYRLAVLSNKPHEFTQKVVKKVLEASFFDRIQGHAEGFALKPEPGSTMAIVEGWGMQADEVVFVGDSSIDMETATQAGCFPVGVTWGYRSKTELIKCGALGLIEHPEQLAAMLAFKNK